VTSFCASESLDSLLVLPLVTGGPGHVKIAITIDGSRASSATQFAGLVAHELGHAIGLGGHSPNAGDVMSGVPTVAAPSAEDARVIRWLLRQPIDLRP
jgi:predicted Zn-dependent protease